MEHTCGHTDSMCEYLKRIASTESPIPFENPVDPPLVRISRAPFLCPVPSCGHYVPVSSVLTHYLNIHSQVDGEVPLTCKEVVSGQKVLFKLDPRKMERKKINCLAVLAYAGPDKSRGSRPAERDLCLYNSCLTPADEYFDAHLAVLVLACKTTWYDVVLKDVDAIDLSEEELQRKELLVLWCASSKTLKPFFCTLTTFDINLSTSASSATQIRHLADSQNPDEFLLAESRYLRLTRGDLLTMTLNFTKPFLVEVIVQEHEGKISFEKGSS